MSTQITGATILITVTAHATLTAGQVHLLLTAREGPAPGTWQYNLHDGTSPRAATGRLTRIPDHMNVLAYAAAVTAPGYEPGTIQRGLLEHFATDYAPGDAPAPPPPGHHPHPPKDDRPLTTTPPPYRTPARTGTIITTCTHTRTWCDRHLL